MKALHRLVHATWFLAAAIVGGSACIGDPVVEEGAAALGAPPSIGPIALQRIVVGSRLSVTVSATDPEGDAVQLGSLRIHDVYTGRRVATASGSCGACARATYTWTPRATGRYEGRVSAGDGTSSSEARFAILVAATANGTFLRGDFTNDGRVDISDFSRLLSYLYSGGAAPDCVDAADVNDDGAVDLSDTVHLSSWLYNGGAAPPEPVEECGADPTADALACHQIDSAGPCAAPPTFVRGDANGDGTVDVTDTQRLMSYLYYGGAVPPCLKAADVNDDGVVDISDTRVLTGWLFGGDPATLPAPTGACGADPTADNLTCLSNPGCFPNGR